MREEDPDIVYLLDREEVVFPPFPPLSLQPPSPRCSSYTDSRPCSTPDPSCHGRRYYGAVRFGGCGANL